MTALLTRPRFRTALLLFGLLPALPGLAHGPKGAAPPKPAHGGVVAMAEGHAIEMVAGGRDLVFHVLDDDGGPLDTAGASGRAFVTENAKTTAVALSPAAPNRLSGPLTAPLPPGAKVVFSARLHGHALQARFEVK